MDKAVKPEEILQTIENMPLKRFHLQMMLVCSLGWLGDNAEMTVLSLLFPILRHRSRGTMMLSTQQMETLGIATGVASAVGSLSFGLLADLTGRRRSFLAAGAVACAAGIASTFAWDFVSLMVLRTLVSFGVGGNMVCAVTSLTEHLPRSVRQPCLVLMQIPWKAGGMYCLGLASHFMPSPEHSDWQSFILLTNLPYAIILASILLRPSLLPESPSFLLHRGQEERLRLYLKHLQASPPIRHSMHSPAEERSQLNHGNFQGYSSDKIQSAREEREEEEEEELGNVAGQPTEEAHRRPVGSFFGEFCSNSTLFATTVCCMVMWFGAMVGSGVQIWLPDILSRVGLSTQQAYQILIIASFVEIASFLTAAPLVHFYKGHMLLPVFLLFAAASASAMAALGTAQTLTAFLVVACGWFFFYGASWPLMYSTTPELFPSTHRAACFGLCSTSSKAASALHPIIAGHLLDVSVRWTLASYAGGWVIATVAASIAGANKVFKKPDRDNAMPVEPAAVSATYQSTPNSNIET